MSTSFSCCMRQKDVAGTRGRKHFQLLDVQWKPQNCLLFNIWKRKQSQIRVLSGKMTFNKSHLSTCMVSRGHFITFKISLREQPGGGKDMGGHLLSLWRCPWSFPSIYLSYTSWKTNRCRKAKIGANMTQGNIKHCVSFQFEVFDKNSYTFCCHCTYIFFVSA